MQYCVDYNTIGDTDGIWIALRRLYNEDFHLGVLTKYDGKNGIIHLRSHFELAKGDNFNNYYYINICQLEEFDKIHMVAYMQSIYEINCESGIPYGPCGGGRFSTSGEYEGNVGHGLSCSSFVLEAFESQGFHFIDKQSWPTRDEDISWQEEIISDFEHSYNRVEGDIKHFEQQRKLIGSLRFRPTEVAASTTFDNYRNKFCDIEPISQSIYNEL